MSENSLPATTEPPRRLRRHWRTGLKNLYRFIRGRGGLDGAMEGMFALAGPTVEREFNRFAADPLGHQLLAERPRRNLTAFLRDHETLAAMPKGSFADAYLSYMRSGGMASEADFLDAADLDEKAARFGWSEDQLWFVRRMALSHDLFHVITGYDRGMIGEVGVIAFTAGQLPLLPVKLLVLSFIYKKPSSPIAWPRFIWRAYRHGKETPNLAAVDYEALLPLPIEEARLAIGMESAEEAHPRGFPALGRTLAAKDVAMNGPGA